MLEHYCDIIVIGTDFPGLVTAAFLAKRGLSVQVIDSDLFQDHQKMPDPVCMTNLHSKMLRSIMGRLNVPELTIQNILGKESNLQVIFPHHRIDVFNNPLTYFEELDREFPDREAELKTFYESQAKLRHRTEVSELFQHLIPSKWSERRNFNKFVKEQNLSESHQGYQDLIAKNDELSSFLKAQFTLAYQLKCDEPFAYQVSELFNPGDGEIFSVSSGLHDYKKVLMERIQHYDGAIRKKVQINQLLFRNGVFEGVELDESHGNVLSKYVLWNTSLTKLDDFLPKKWRFRKLRKCAENHPYQENWFTARYTIDPQYIPDPMNPNVIMVQDPKKDLLGDNYLYLQIKKDKLSPVSTIDVNFLLPKEYLNKNPEDFDVYFENIHKHLLKVFPFSEKSLVQTFPEKQPEQPQDTLFPLNEDDFEIFKHSASLHGVHHQKEKNFAKLFPNHYKTNVQNFYLSHPSIFSPFGIESKLILGLKITDSIWAEVEKVKRKAMRSERRIA